MKSRYTRIILLILVCLSGVTPLKAAVVPTLEQADSAYTAGDYDKAATLYSEIEKSRGVTAPMLFNMGNAYYKSGDEGMAMLCYRRAYRLNPDLSRLEDNIRFLESKIEDVNKAELKGKKGSVTPDPEGFFSRLGDSIAADNTSNYWGVMGAMAFVLFLGAVAAYLFSPGITLKKIGFFSAIVMFLFSVVLMSFSFVAARHFEKRNEAVITEFKYNLLEQPEQNSPKAGFPLHRGTTLEILESEQGPNGEPEWYKVKLNSRNIGWISATAVAVV